VSAADPQNNPAAHGADPTGEKIVTAAILIIGNEILSGRTQDANISYIAKGLNDVGVTLREARVIPDIEATVVATVNELRAKYDYLFTTGGIGPTHDDITSECIAKAFGVPWVVHPEAHKHFLQFYAPGDLNPARMRMATTPEGATLVYNPVSRAPGFKMGNVYVFAGIPRVMQGMFDAIKGELKGGRPMLSRTIATSLAEGVLAKRLGDIQNRYGDIEIGSYPIMRRGSFGVNLVLRGRAPARLAEATEEVAQMVRELGDTPVEEPAPV
jgi:molybdenum cofactor synthesis domain-containing protein